jgi:uncharacterized protein (DUF983 family)
MGDEMRERLTQPNPRLISLIGLGLVGVGIVLLLRELNVAWVRWLDFDVLWPVILVILGIVLIARYFKGE